MSWTADFCGLDYAKDPSTHLPVYIITLSTSSKLRILVVEVGQVKISITNRHLG
jgi:hypothetical protein